ncbi:MAG: DUF2264 domain-containing protein [Spirochaetales bacterium]|jgi:hypothetical protein|nr:DUF2264 domain-containing protein [Spirochaetales bacterium]
MSDERSYWLETMLKIADPVISALAEGRLKKDMPVECKAERQTREKFTYLEALGRTLCGFAPWLDCKGLSREEEEKRVRYADLTRKAIDNATNPASADVMNFSEGIQPICDAAFFAHGLLRAPVELMEKLEPRVKKNIIDRLIEVRSRKPGYNNFLLFAAMIEAAIYKLGGIWDPMRVDYAIRTHETWYKGDGVYSDGPEYCWNYYNSFVIQPMYVDILALFGPVDPDWEQYIPAAHKRAKRYAAIQERLINPDGSFPPVGRSLAYRFGAFQHLSQMALQHSLPDVITPAQVRSGLTAMIKRVMAADTFDAKGWLRIGFCGAQPGVGEVYISTGSLYLCMAVFLPLGLPPQDDFWASPAMDWTSRRMWSGGACDIDEALHFTKHKTIYDHDTYLAHGGQH